MAVIHRDTKNPRSRKPRDLGHAFGVAPINEIGRAFYGAAAGKNFIPEQEVYPGWMSR
jgi:hypothetical protein